MWSFGAVSMLGAAIGGWLAWPSAVEHARGGAVGHPDAVSGSGASHLTALPSTGRGGAGSAVTPAADAPPAHPSALTGEFGERAPSELASGSVATERSAPGRGANRLAGAVPRVGKEMAFTALSYVGIDPQAERLWMRAIDDPGLPEGVRSDLIEDLNNTGYPDPDQLTEADLPLILARLEIIERLAPYAMDAVNAAAFEEAYKDLLNMYARIRGAAIRPR